VRLQFRERHPTGIASGPLRRAQACRDRLLCLPGRPYDTLKEVIGLLRAAAGSLAEFGTPLRRT